MGYFGISVQTDLGMTPGRVSSGRSGYRQKIGALLIVVVATSGCGGSDRGSGEASDELQGGTRASIEQTLSDFAFYVEGASIPEMCRLLAGQARRDQGCGTNAADLGPQLRLAIDGPGDIRLDAIRGGRAIASFPDYRTKRDGVAPERLVRQKLILREVDPRTWKIVRIIWGPR